jgi:hypothetical protein
MVYIHKNLLFKPIFHWSVFIDSLAFFPLICCETILDRDINVAV